MASGVGILAGILERPGRGSNPRAGAFHGLKHSFQISSSLFENAEKLCHECGSLALSLWLCRVVHYDSYNYCIIMSPKQIITITFYPLYYFVTKKHILQ